jgi:PIN domain nuclease of toxin-antitoxin system
VEALYLDTHAVVWLFAGAFEKFSKEGIDRIESSRLYISPIVLLELQYLYEIKRIRYESDYIFNTLAESIDLTVCEASFRDVAIKAAKHDWTRDPFDRMIVAQTECGGGILLSKDRNVLRHFKKAVW